ncbi:hypothetical protein [Streptomyces sp. 147326]|uniref:hypothetical protein n=1 Tax=Streptomyces sp. 147326 TaxID=3074379 RepID=UPI003857428E
MPAAARASGSRPGTGAHAAAGDRAGPTPASTGTQRPPGRAIAKHRKSSRHAPSGPAAPGSSSAARAHAASSAPGKAVRTGSKKIPVASSSATTCP